MMIENFTCFLDVLYIDNCHYQSIILLVVSFVVMQPAFFVVCAAKFLASISKNTLFCVRLQAEQQLPYL